MPQQQQATLPGQRQHPEPHRTGILLVAVVSTSPGSAGPRSACSAWFRSAGAQPARSGSLPP